MCIQYLQNVHTVTPECAYSISKHTLPGKTLFFVKYGFHSQLHSSLPTDSDRPVAREWVHHIHKVPEELVRHLEKAKKGIKAADEQCQPGPVYSRGRKCGVRQTPSHGFALTEAGPLFPCPLPHNSSSQISIL